MKIEHIAAWCNDLEKTKEFFVKFFEARSNEKYVNKIGFESYFLSFDSGARLELMHMDPLAIMVITKKDSVLFILQFQSDHKVKSINLQNRL